MYFYSSSNKEKSTSVIIHAQLDKYFKLSGLNYFTPMFQEVVVGPT